MDYPCQKAAVQRQMDFNGKKDTSTRISRTRVMLLLSHRTHSSKAASRVMSNGISAQRTTYQQQSKEIDPDGLRGSIASIRKVLIVQMDCRVGLYYGMTKMVLAEQTKTPMPAFFQKEYLITTQRYSFAVRPPVTDIKSQ